MYHLLEWLNGLLRLENINAILGSLKRRVLGLDFLEMRITLDDVKIPSPIWSDPEIKGYSENLEGECISLLNSIGSLGLWNQSRFRNEILSSTEDAKNDIFIACMADSVIGFAVLQKKSLSNNLNEIGYVAVSPAYRGKRVGYKLLMYILAEMKRRNISQAYLRTDSFRIPAIKTYLRAGFHPFVKSTNERMRWQEAMKRVESSV